MKRVHVLWLIQFVCLAVGFGAFYLCGQHDHWTWWSFPPDQKAYSLMRIYTAALMFYFFFKWVEVKFELYKLQNRKG